MIQIQQLSLEAWDTVEDIYQNAANPCMLFWTAEKQNIKLLFYSTHKSIRALEFMDYLVQEYVLVQGDARRAEAVLTPILLQSMMSEFQADGVEMLLERIVEGYFSNCDWIYAADYAKEHREEILQMPLYKKKKVTWAFVKTTDLVEEGKTFYLKSLENESESIITASPDLYVMIGRYGETYHIRRERFEDTYETSGEPVDMLEQIFTYFPEVRTCDTEEFITLDEMACVCWPKVKSQIYAVPLERRTKVFNPYNDHAQEYFVGHRGDYLAVRQDDISDMYIIKQDIFADTYERIQE